MDEVDSVSVLPKYENTEVSLSKNGKNVDTTIFEKLNNETIGEQNIKTRLYYRRFFILIIFCLYSMSSAFQWIEYAIIMDIIMKYYNTSELAVTWTSMIYMLSYIPLVFVATWMLDNWGLRRILLLGATLNAVGSLIKIGSVAPHLFAVSFVGQTIAACAQSFILEIPPKIASLWFGPSEVSTATSIGVFGNQLGVALGFFLPPIIVPNFNDDGDNVAEVETGLRMLFISSAAVCTVIAILIFMVIRDQPALPPSKARALSRLTENKNEGALASFKSYKNSIINLMKDVPFLLLLISYGINTGTYYAIGTLLNPILLENHEDAGRQVGEIGLTMVVAGLAGSVVCGVILDKTKLYKMTTIVIYVLSLVFMVVFTFTYHLALWVDYVVIGLLGFFMTGYLPIGFEFAAEITYPESEATSSGLLNVSAQIFGILFILVAQELHKHFGSLSANIFMSAALLAGLIMTVLIKENLRRQNAETCQKSSESEEVKTPVLPLPSYNENQNNNIGTDPPKDDERLIRMTSASSCYSA